MHACVACPGEGCSLLDTLGASAGVWVDVWMGWLRGCVVGVLGVQRTLHPCICLQASTNLSAVEQEVLQRHQGGRLCGCWHTSLARGGR
jgi:hypothetical protein